MKTILIEEPGKVVIKEQEKPIRKPGEVLLKILYGGICGSDLGTEEPSHMHHIQEFRDMSFRERL